MVTTMFSACSDNGGDWSPVKHPECKEGGYLFAHMTNENYGSLFYSVSRAFRGSGELERNEAFQEHLQ